MRQNATIGRPIAPTGPGQDLNQLMAALVAGQALTNESMRRMSADVAQLAVTTGRFIDFMEVWRRFDAPRHEDPGDARSAAGTSAAGTSAAGTSRSAVGPSQRVSASAVATAVAAAVGASQAPCGDPPAPRAFVDLTHESLRITSPFEMSELLQRLMSDADGTYSNGIVSVSAENGGVKK